MDWYRDVREFHKEMDIHIGEFPRVPSGKTKELRISLIEEEIGETLQALSEDNLVEIADGIIDSIVVLLGTAISYGIDVRPIWDEIHRSNMAKVGGPVREDGKRLKPGGWTPPKVRGLLLEQMEEAKDGKDTI